MKKFSLYTLLIMCFLISFPSCEEETEPLAYAPTLAIGQATETTRSSATLAGNVVRNPNSQAKFEIGFLISTSQSMADTQTVTAQASGGNEHYAGQVKGLTPGTDYYFCLYAKSGRSLVKSEVQRFRTVEATAPVLSETLMESKDEQSAIFRSGIVDDGGYAVSAKGFAYKVYVEGESSPTINNDLTVRIPEESETFTATATELQPNTAYMVRAFATNQTGTGYGEAVIITTEKQRIPLLTLEQTVSQLTGNSAELTANLTDDQGFEIKQRGFCWSTESRQPTIDLEENTLVVAGTQTGTFSGTISNLSPKTRYYVRAFAENEKGVGYSAPIELTTDELQMASLTRLAVVDLTTSSVTITAQMETSANAVIIEKGICWGSKPEPTILDNPIVSKETGNLIKAVISNLSESTTYYAAAYATTRDGTFYSAPLQFNTAGTSKPVVSSPVIGDISETGAKATASVTDNGGSEITEKGICWVISTANNREPAKENTEGKYLADESAENSISIQMDKLTKGTRYFVRSYAINKNGVTYSATKEFTTHETFAPAVSGVKLSEISETAATVTATITSDGGATVEEKGVCYHTDKATPPTIDHLKVISTAQGNNISSRLTNLSKGTLYYVRAYAKNKNGVAYSQTVSELKTSTLVAPSVSSLTVTDIKNDNARARAMISSDGGATITERGFVWSMGENGSPTIDKGSYTGKVVSTTAGTSLSFEAVMQQPAMQHSTSYSVRAYATNSAGTGYSSSISFVTGSSSVPTNGEVTFSNITGKGVIMKARISSNGGASITKAGFVWTRTQSWGLEENGTHANGTISGNDITLSIDTLVHNSTYYVMAWSENKNGRSYSNLFSFQTDKMPPGEDDNQPPIQVTGKIPTMNEVTCTGRYKNRLEITSSVADNGQQPVTASGFVWSATNSEPTQGGEGCTDVPVTLDKDVLKAVITGLTINTTYYIRSYAVNKKGTGYSNTAYITTEAEKDEPGEDDNNPPVPPR